MNDRPLILITNDDGIEAAGLTALKKALSPVSRAIVVAPTQERSACSHAITLNRPLSHTQHQDDVYSVDGTPADCVALSLFGNHFLPRKPDLVLSGINHGVNLGTDTFYSGTVAAAREAAMRGIAAMAISYQGSEKFDEVAETAKNMALALLFAPKPAGAPVLLNVNFPRGAAEGVLITHLSMRVYEEFGKPPPIPRADRATGSADSPQSEIIPRDRTPTRSSAGTSR